MYISSSRCVFRLKDILFRFELNIFLARRESEISRHIFVCLLDMAVVHNHFSSSSFFVFRIGGVFVFVKDQGVLRALSPLGLRVSAVLRLRVSLAEGDCYWFFASERRGGLLGTGSGLFPHFFAHFLQ